MIGMRVDVIRRKQRVQVKHGEEAGKVARPLPVTVEPFQGEWM